MELPSCKSEIGVCRDGYVIARNVGEVKSFQQFRLYELTSLVTFPGLCQRRGAKLLVRS